jgi:hypothetical protein
MAGLLVERLCWAGGEGSCCVWAGDDDLQLLDSSFLPLTVALAAQASMHHDWHVGAAVRLQGARFGRGRMGRGQREPPPA